MDYDTHNYHELNSKGNSMNYSRKFCYFKKAIKIILSISIFSLLYSQSTSIVPVFIHSFHNYYFSDFSIKIFSYNSERNYIFLLCNGILVLIIQTSGLISKISPVERNTTSKARGTTITIDHDEATGKTGKAGEFQEKKTKGTGKVDFLDQEKGQSPVIKRDDDDDDDDDGSAEVETADKKLDENLEKVENFPIIWEEHVEEIDDDDGEMINADELHKKCEDFIKKVKQEIQVEFVAGSLILNDD